MAKESYQIKSETSSPESGSLELNSVGTAKYEDVQVSKGSYTSRIIDSFKRDPHARATPAGVVGADGKVFDVEAAAQATADSPLHRKLKGRHLQMIAIGGSIGMVFWCNPLLTHSHTSRHGSIRRLREVLVEWRSSISLDRIQLDRCHAVLHSPSPR